MNKEDIIDDYDLVDERLTGGHFEDMRSTYIGGMFYGCLITEENIDKYYTAILECQLSITCAERDSGDSYIKALENLHKNYKW